VGRGDGIDEACLREALLAELTGVAEATGAAIGFGLVAGPGEREIHAELVGAGHDLRLGLRDEWRVYAVTAPSLDPRLGRQVRQALEGLDEFRAAVRIAGVVEGLANLATQARAWARKMVLRAGT